MSFWRLYYHLVWATCQRAPLLPDAVERQVYGAILGTAKEMGILIHAVGGVQDHVHVVASMPPKIANADCIRHFKGASSYCVNRQPDASSGFFWQDGYGALTVGQRGLPDVVACEENGVQVDAR